MSPDTYSSLLRVTQQRELKDATQNLNRLFSISDRSLENVLHLVTQTRSEVVGLKFVWVCVQIGQLSCKACVCVRGTPSMKEKAPFKMLSVSERRLLLSEGVHCFFGWLIHLGRMTLNICKHLELTG